MKLRTLFAALALIAMPALSFAQNPDDVSLSRKYKVEIQALKSEIKALKSRIKLNPEDASLVTEMNSKKALLKDTQDRKKTIDNAIKADKASKKASEKAEKARAKAMKANRAAQEIRQK